jgi:hypothetical protein
MPGRKRRAVPSDLARAIGRFKQWRRARVSRTRIPAALWTLAVKAAGRHGVARTAAALKLDYYALKNRLPARPVPVPVAEPGRSSPPAAFTEFTPGPLFPSPCVLEFSDPTGSTLRVQLPAGQVPDLVALGRTLWDGR